MAGSKDLVVNVKTAVVLLRTPRVGEREATTRLFILDLRQRDCRLVWSSRKSINVNDVRVLEDSLSCSMTTRAASTLVKEIWILRVDIEFVFQNVHPDTGAPFHEKLVVPVREEINFHFLWSP